MKNREIISPTAPAGLEPATFALTVRRSTIEPWSNYF